MRIRLGLVLLFAYVGAAFPAFSQASDPQHFTVSAVQVEGNQRVDSEALLALVDSKPGVVASEAVSKDVRTLYESGYFDTVRAALRKDARGAVLYFVVAEKPVVRKVFITGNDNVSEADLSSALAFEGRRHFDRGQVERLMRNARMLYQARGYYDAQIRYELSPVGDNQVDVTFSVDEGKRYKIRRIEFAGLESIDGDDLAAELATSEYAWWSSWLTGSGRLNQEALNADQLIIRQYLVDHGYLEGSVAEPSVNKEEDGLTVTFAVNEGPQYTVSAIRAGGDLLDGSEEKTLDGLQSEVGEVFSAAEARADSFTISEKFGDQGYAFANVVPLTDLNPQQRQVELRFEIQKGEKVRVDKIRIKGNDKTYDNVIRREMRVQEQEQYSTSKVKRSERLLKRLGYFEEASIATVPTGDPQLVDLEVSVREGPTGSFSIGAGFSSSDGALFNSRLSEANFMGTGRRLDLNLDLGTEMSNGVISIDDPRFNDSNWSLGTDLFMTDREFIDFDRSVRGAGVTGGYRLEEYFSSWAEDMAFSLKYEYQQIEISDVNPEDAAELVVESEGKTSSSSITPRLTRNTIDNPLNPSEGSRQVLSLELAGLGGEEKFFLLEFRNQWYYPLIKWDTSSLVFSWRSVIGYGETFDGDTFPLFRRYFPGGINSVRGFDSRTLGPKDSRGNEYGGPKELVSNFELIFPLVSSAGFKGVVFYDFGEAFDDDESIELAKLRQAYGAGIRWQSPMGPLRLEFGFPVDREDGEEGMVTLFSFGAPY